MGTPLRLLMVEDSDDDATLALRVLQRGGYDVTCTRVETAAAMRAALTEERWDLVLSDYSLPRFSAPAALALLLEVSPDTPLIVVSGACGEDTAVELIRSGARDFFLKHSLVRLVHAVERELDAAKALAKRRATEEALRVAAEQARAAQERALRFFTLSLELLCVLDLEGRFLELNPMWEEALGFTLDELRGRAFSDFVHPDDREATRAVWRGLAPGERPVSFESRCVAKDGSARSFLWSATVSPGERHCYAAARDITPLREAQEDLRARAERQQTIAQLGQLALARPGEVAAILGEAAAAVARTLRVEHAHVLELVEDASAFEVVAGVGGTSGLGSFPSGAAFQPGFALRAGAPVVTADFRVEARFARPPLLPDDVVSGGCVVLPGTKGPLGVLGAFATEARCYSPEETAFMQSVAHVVATVLQRRDAEAALDALEGQLRQAQKMDAVGRLAGGVAHDFNNLLTAILGYSELLLAGLERDDPRWRQVEQIRKAGERATSLTKQLLVFSRHQQVERRVIDVNAIVADMEVMLTRLIGEDLAVELVLAPDLGRVLADAGQVEQIILNLAVNARDAMPQGGRITIETANVLLAGEAKGLRRPVEPGDYVMLAVSDVGTGIADDVLTHLFEPFFTTKPAGKGTGLGLSTVYGIASSAKGTVSVDTELGSGTTFKVYLPRVDREAERTSRSAELPVLRGSETILLVEDDDLVRGLSEGVLRENGYVVIGATNGVEALRASEAHEGPIHLVVTDVVMPEMGGKELVERLQPLRPGLKVLYASGYTSGVVLHDEGQPGAGFIQKPFAPKSLLSKVRDLLGQ